MARTTKAERKRRREAALVKISEAYGFADTVTFVMSEWGCSRSTARRDCHWAHGELQLGLIHGPRSELIVPAIFMPAPDDGAFQAGETFHGSDQHPK